MTTFVVLVQNLQKTEGLATKLWTEHQPDIALMQEICLASEDAAFADAANVSQLSGFGTAIRASSNSVTNVRKVLSPHAEFLGLLPIVKKTTIATCLEAGIECVSFHGYNGTPFRRVDCLVDHVKAALAELASSESPAIFAGDFNTWTPEHLSAVSAVLAEAGFVLATSWPYPGREHALDHVFLRRLELKDAKIIESAADHRGAVCTLSLT